MRRREGGRKTNKGRLFVVGAVDPCDAGQSLMHLANNTWFIHRHLFEFVNWTISGNEKNTSGNILETKPEWYKQISFRCSVNLKKGIWVDGGCVSQLPSWSVEASLRGEGWRRCPAVHYGFLKRSRAAPLGLGIADIQIPNGFGTIPEMVEAGRYGRGLPLWAARWTATARHRPMPSHADARDAEETTRRENGRTVATRPFATHEVAREKAGYPGADLRRIGGPGPRNSWPGIRRSVYVVMLYPSLRKGYN
jgi:hypothetical protein